MQTNPPRPPAPPPPHTHTHNNIRSCALGHGKGSQDRSEILSILRDVSWIRSDQVSKLKWEHKWKAKLVWKTYSVKKHRYLPPPIIFSWKYMGKTPAINTLERSRHKQSQTGFGIFCGIPITRQLIYICQWEKLISGTCLWWQATFILSDPVPAHVLFGAECQLTVVERGDSHAGVRRSESHRRRPLKEVNIGFVLLSKQCKIN